MISPQIFSSSKFLLDYFRPSQIQTSQASLILFLIVEKFSNIPLVYCRYTLIHLDSLGFFKNHSDSFRFSQIPICLTQSTTMNELLFNRDHSVNATSNPLSSSKANNFSTLGQSEWMGMHFLRHNNINLSVTSNEALDYKI